jgi:hypothetical protein
LIGREFEVRSIVKSIVEASANMIDGKSLAVLQINYRSVYNKALKFWNSVDMYNPDVVTGME